MIDGPKVSVTHKHMDLLKAIRRLRQIVQTTTSAFHIYGHQDKHTPYHKLSRDVQLNVQMDSIAQHVLLDAFERDQFIKQPVFPQEGYQLWLNSHKVQSRFRIQLRRHIGMQNLRQYLYTKQLIAWNTSPSLTGMC